MKSVKKTVSGLDGVEKAEVDFDSRTVTITMKEGKALSKEVLDKAFEGTQFSVSKFEVEGDKKEGTVAASVHKAEIAGMT